MFIFVFIWITLLFGYNNNQIMESIFESDGWEEVSIKSDSLTVYKKHIKGVDIPVFKATALTHIDMDGILEAILDADGQDEFLENSHLVESTLIDHSINDTTFLYQILDLPIISNRHYITKNYTDTVSLSHFRLNWMIDSDQNYRLFKNIIDEKNQQYNDPIFIENGLGSWEVKALSYDLTEVSYYVLIDPGGWIPDYLITYGNKSLGPGTVLLMLEEGAKRGYDTTITSSYLFCIRNNHSPIIFAKTDTNDYIVMNNNEIQEYLLNNNNIKNLEQWMPSASDNDCSDGICLNRIYRIEFEHKKNESLRPLLDRLSSIPSILYVEEEVSRNRTLKR